MIIEIVKTILELGGMKEIYCLINQNTVPADDTCLSVPMASTDIILQLHTI